MKCKYNLFEVLVTDPKEIGSIKHVQILYVENLTYEKFIYMSFQQTLMKINI